MSSEENITFIIVIFLIIIIFSQRIKIKKLTSELHEKILKFECVEKYIEELK